MANKCVLITALPRTYKEWYVKTKNKMETDGKSVSNEQLEKIWLDHMTKNDKSGLMQYIHHSDRGARTAIQFGKSTPKETMILGVKDNQDGTTTVATLDGVYTFTNESAKSIDTYKGNNVTMPIMEDIHKQSAAEVSGFSVPFNVLSGQANAWASKYMLIGLADKSGKIIGPLIKKAHVAAKKKSSLYRQTTNLIADGYRNSEFLAKLRATLGMTGDIDKKALHEAITVAYNSARWTREVLDTDLPKLDKWISAELRNAEDRKNLNTIFGQSGFMHLMDNQDLMGEINKGKASIDDLIKMIPHNSKQLKEAQELKTYLIKGILPSNRNTNSTGSKTVEQLAALLALKDDAKLWDTMVKVRSKHPKLWVELLKISGMVKSLNEVILKGKENSIGKGSKHVYSGYDGHGMMDVYDDIHEYRVVDIKEMERLTERDPRWIVVRVPTKTEVGILSRRGMDTFQEGIGLDKDVIRNGVQIDTQYVDSMVGKYGPEWLAKNNIASDTDSGYVRYRVVLKQQEKEANKYLGNVAHTLYRTWVHNAQIVEMQTVQQLVLDKMTATGEVGVDEMEKVITRNNKVDKDKRKEVKPFLSTQLTMDELKEQYPEVAKRYVPVKNVSTYNNMRNMVTYVRKDMEDILIGYPTGSLINEDATFGVPLQRVETVYKQLVQMIKLKMVVANPKKLAVDMLSNTSLLLAMDVGIGEIYSKYPKTLTYSKELSGLEGNLVSAKLKLAQAEAMRRDTTSEHKLVERVTRQLKAHPFYIAVEHGFIQSQGTSMLVKEFDTITGLQKTIDEAIGYIMKDSKGNTTAMHDAVVWMMNAGFGLDDILNSVSNMSKIKGTTVGKELEGIAERLASKKGKDIIKAEEKALGRKLTKEELDEVYKDADTVRYVSEFIAAPGSEIVRQGSRAMQMGDLMGRWVLFTHEVEKAMKEKGLPYTTFEELYKNKGKVDQKWYEETIYNASELARETFIDYRINMPKEIKVLSDYGVLLFPSFWIKAQKVIYNLAKYHPINAGVGLLAAELLGVKGASIIDANILSKAYEGTLVHAGVDVFKAGTIVLGL